MKLASHAVEFRESYNTANGPENDCVGSYLEVVSNHLFLQILLLVIVSQCFLFSFCYFFLIFSILPSYFSYQFTSFKGAQYSLVLLEVPLYSPPPFSIVFCIFELNLNCIFELRLILCFSKTILIYFALM